MGNNNNYTLIAAVIAAIVSAIGILVQVGLGVYNNRQIKKLEQKKIDADLISKSRIAWIQNVRGILSEYITVLYSVRHYSYEYAIGSTRVYTLEESGKMSDEKIQEAIQLRELLILNLSDSTEHEEFTNSIITTYAMIKDIKSNPTKYEFSKLNNEMRKLSDIGRNYFKKEWDKAKLGK